MVQEAVPELHRKPPVAADEYEEQVVFEGADCMIDRVAYMDVGGRELVFNVNVCDV